MKQTDTAGHLRGSLLQPENRGDAAGVVSAADGGASRTVDLVAHRKGAAAGLLLPARVHGIGVADSKLVKGVSNGWPHILASLKSLLETGKALDRTDKLPG